jgi:serine protease AprX
MKPIPTHLVEYVLRGRGRRDAVDRMAQDGGIVAEVWLSYAQRPDRTLPLLLSPVDGVAPVRLGAELHRRVHKFRHQDGQRVGWPSPRVSPAEDFVAASLRLEELVYVVLPMTKWRQSFAATVGGESLQDDKRLHAAVRHAVLALLGQAEPLPPMPSDAGVPNQALDRARQHVNSAAPVLTLLALFWLAESGARIFDGLRTPQPRDRGSDEQIQAWLARHGKRIATAAIEVLKRLVVAGPAATPRRKPLAAMPPSLAVDIPRVRRVFVDRSANLSVAEGCRTLKADAAARLFQVSCSRITWAVIDAGIAGGHAAFRDHAAPDAAASRIRGAYDFTRLSLIRNFDNTLDDEGSEERDQQLQRVIDALLSTPGRQGDDEFRRLALANLNLIARQLEQELMPDWALLEPLLRLSPAESRTVISDHGTHVAGILAADWREPTAGLDEDDAGQPLTGVCPDIRLLDLRVVHESDMKATESALLGALEFVRHLNDRDGRRQSVVHGVNISLSIPHDVDNYACGATPICRAADRLSDSGVVVVAAAGNRGWAEQELGFGQYAQCSITDPGNARKVITVGSTHRAEPHSYGVSYFSSRGPTGDGRVKPELLAPGEKILGPLPGNLKGRKSGTSMAAPFVSGAAAMLLGRYPELTGQSDRIRQILCQSATDLGRERYFQGHGLVDVLRALQSV